MSIYDITYWLGNREIRLYHKFVGFNGANMTMDNVDYRTSLSLDKTRIDVWVSACIGYSDIGLFTRSYALENFEEACTEYIEEVVSEEDEDDRIVAINVHFNLTASKIY